MKAIGNYIHKEERAASSKVIERETSTGNARANVIMVLVTLKDILVTLIMLLSIGCYM
jgi:hypothetical protein